MLSDYRRGSRLTESFQDWLGTFLCSHDIASDVLRVMERRELVTGEILCEQGEQADELFFVARGRVRAIYRSKSGESVRLRVTEQRTVLGEIGFFSASRRTASLEAETPVVVYVLSTSTYESLCSQHPRLSNLLLEAVLGVVIQRFTVSSELVSAYEERVFKPH